MKSTVAQALAGALGYIYLEPLAEERGRRRLRDLQARGERRSLAAVTADIRQRDLQDSTRDVAPLRPAQDAVRIDSTALDVGEVVGAMLDVVRARGGGPASGGEASGRIVPATRSSTPAVKVHFLARLLRAPAAPPAPRGPSGRRTMFMPASIREQMWMAQSWGPVPLLALFQASSGPGHIAESLAGGAPCLGSPGLSVSAT